MELATRPSSRKGSYGHPPKVWKYGAQRRGEVYNQLKGVQNAMAIVGRAVPLPLPVKNREKARERTNFPVCLPLTQNGDRLKRLEGHE